MAEKLIPISKKQHDAINGLTDTIAAHQRQLQTVANTLLLGQDEEVTGAIVGAQVRDGVHVLVINVPDAPAQADAS